MLFPSLIILLSGTYLLLSRTKPLPDNDEGDFEYAYAIPQLAVEKKKVNDRKKRGCTWKFGGGWGGLLIGFAFGGMSFLDT